MALRSRGDVIENSKTGVSVSPPQPKKKKKKRKIQKYPSHQELDAEKKVMFNLVHQLRLVVAHQGIL